MLTISKTTIIHLDMKFQHDLELLRLLLEFNLDINNIASKVVTTTNTMDAFTRQVQIEIELDDYQVCQYDGLIEIIGKLKMIDSNCKIETMNIFVSNKSDIGQ